MEIEKNETLHVSAEEPQESEEELEYEGLSGVELLEKGKAAFRAKDFEGACELLATSVERRVAELVCEGKEAEKGEEKTGGNEQKSDEKTVKNEQTNEEKNEEKTAKNEDRNAKNDVTTEETNKLEKVEWHEDLAEYYLWYGDALLCKEEASNELFQFLSSDNPKFRNPFLKPGSSEIVEGVPERSENTEKIEENAEKTEENTEKKPENTVKNENAEKIEKNENTEKTENAENIEKIENAKKIEKAEKMEGKMEENANKMEENVKKMEENAEKMEENAEKIEQNAEKNIYPTEDTSEQKDSIDDGEGSVASRDDIDLKENSLMKNLALLEAVMQEAGEAENNDQKEEIKEEENVSDEQLAFEILEMAKNIYTKKLQKIQAQNVKPDFIQDLSFVHIRLGDIWLTNEKFLEAYEDYKLAVDLREKYEGGGGILSPMISLAQCLHFAGKVSDALTQFERCVELAEASLADQNTDTQKSQALKDTAEDLKIQIDEIKANQLDAQIPKTGSQIPIHQLIPKTTNTLDEPKLGEGSTVSLGVVTKNPRKNNGAEYNDISAPKKRRIDLTNLAQ